MWLTWSCNSVGLNRHSIWSRLRKAPTSQPNRLDAALHVVRYGVRSAHVVDARVPNALLLDVLKSEGAGATILPDDAPQFLADTRRYLAPADDEMPESSHSQLRTMAVDPGSGNGLLISSPPVRGADHEHHC